jgi:hypothetical protein
MANNTLSSCVLGASNQNNLKHIISKESGATYNIEPLYESPQSFLIYHKPYRKGEHSHVLSVRDDKLYTAPKDIKSDNQKWIMKNTTDGYLVIVPYLDSNKQNYNVLQYDNGFLSIRIMGNYNGQKWILNPNGPSTNTIRSCTLNSSNIQSNDTLDYIENQALHNNYQQQIGGIINLINSNLQHFDKETRYKTDGNKTVSTVFGGGNPINLKINVIGENNTEKFNSVKKDNVLDLLNRYEQQ